MNCSLTGCSGQYEEHTVMHTVRHQGNVVVIDHVPAEVCPMCGDILFKPEAIVAMEHLLKSKRHPDATVPLYEYAGLVA